MNKQKQQAVLKILEKGIKAILTDKYFEVNFGSERDWELRGTEIFVIGRALGETLDEIFYPTHWVKFLKRKDCPKYMKKLTRVNVDAYYPQLSIPKEKNYITIDNLGSKTAEEWEEYK